MDTTIMFTNASKYNVCARPFITTTTTTTTHNNITIMNGLGLYHPTIVTGGRYVVILELLAKPIINFNSNSEGVYNTE